jgi:hypothetical protein
MVADAEPVRQPSARAAHHQARLVAAERHAAARRPRSRTSAAPELDQVWAAASAEGISTRTPGPMVGARVSERM